MIFGKSKLELKVGIFVFVGLIILMSFILLIGDIKSWKSGYYVNFMFNFINGVKIGAPVRFAGVDVGEVKKIKFIFSPKETKTKVQIISHVRKGIKIPADSTVWVNTLGLLGEKYVEVMPGTDYAHFMRPNETLTGTDPIAMQQLGELAKKIATDIDAAFVKINKGEGTVGKLIYDDKVYTEIEALVTDLKKHPWKLFWKGKED